jgi:hypothetical protein
MLTKAPGWRMFRRSGQRFADKDMRQARINGHFRSEGLAAAVQFERKWL